MTMKYNIRRSIDAGRPVKEAERLREELKTLKNQHEGLKIAYRLACSNKNREDKNFELEG